MGHPLIEELRPALLAEIASQSLLLEKARREPPHGVFKWWGRRFTALSRAVLASLVLRPGEEDLLRGALQGRPHPLLAERARGMLVVDPFAGAGTIPLEAGYLGFSAVGIDILRSAVLIARSTLEIVEPGCQGSTGCLARSLEAAWVRLRHLWESPLGTVVHVFLARCDSTHCRVPALLTVRKRRNGRQCLLIGPTGPYWASGEDCVGVGPTEPGVEAPRELLAWAAPGVYAYAAELVTRLGQRVFVSFTSPEWPGLAAWLGRSAREAQGLLTGGDCTPVPRRGEPARLRRHGVECWEEIFTPRQLASLRAFVGEADARGCGHLARTVAASASRSASLLAVYYQPAGKVNPGLVIKGYWLPAYPVELNPLGHRQSRRGPPLPLGRGGVASVVRRAWRACTARPLPEHATVRFQVGDATRPETYPGRMDHVVTDPPYPGMQDYTGLTWLYKYWHGLPPEPPAGRDSTGAIKGMLRAARGRLARGGYLVMMIGAGVNHTDKLIEVLHEAARLYGLRKIYWLPGEPPGGLGRSRVRGLYVVVARKGAPHRPDALEPLGWTGWLAGRLAWRVDVELEVERSRRIVEALSGVVSRPSPMRAPGG